MLRSKRVGWGGCNNVGLSCACTYAMLPSRWGGVGYDNVGLDQTAHFYVIPHSRWDVITLDHLRDTTHDGVGWVAGVR